MHRLVLSLKKWKLSLPIVFLVLSISVHNAVGRKCVCTSKACKAAGIDVCRTRFSCYTEEIYDNDGTPRDNSSTRGCTEGATPLLCETNAWTRSSKPDSMLTNFADDSTNILSLDGPNVVEKQEIHWPRLKCCDSHDYCNSIVDDQPSHNDDRRNEKSRMNATTRFADDKINSGTRGAMVSSSNGRSMNDQNEANVSPEVTSGTSINDRERNSTRTTNTTRIVTNIVDNREISYDPLRHHVGSLHLAVVVLAIAALTSVLGACYVITRFLRSPFEVSSP